MIIGLLFIFVLFKNSFALVCSKGNQFACGQCVPCPYGMYNTGYFPFCIDVTPGYYLQGNGDVAQCGKNTYSLGNTNYCTSCPHGTYQNSDGPNRYCLTVPPGYYLYGGNSVEKCGKQTYSLGWAHSCTTCPYGTYQDNDGPNTACVDAPPGYNVYVFYGGRSLVACGPHTYSLGQTQFCFGCPYGTYQDSEGQTTCISAPPGSYVYEYYGGRSLVACGPHTYSLGQTQFCFSCPYGTYQDLEGETSCIDAPPGSYVYEYYGGRSLESCGPHQYSRGLTQFCFNCPYGTYQDSVGPNTYCISAPPGSYVYEYYGGRSLVACGPHTYSLGQTQFCFNCPYGTYQDREGEAYCIGASPGSYVYEYYGGRSLVACGPHTYSLGLTQFCFNCPYGTYQDSTGQSTCIDAPPGTYVYVYYGGRSLEVCGQNTYSLGQTQFCFDCPYGTYQDSVGQISCTDAPLGYVVRVVWGGRSLDVCGRGTYSSGTNSCLNCPFGTYQPNTGGIDCIDVPAGYRSNAPTGADSVLACEPGYYSNGMTNYCTQCPYGTYQPNTGSTDCQRVASGAYAISVSGATNAYQCLEGYCSSGMTNFCYLCDADDYSLTNDVCHAGYVGSGLNCEPCPSGTYYKNNQCVNVPAGSIPNAFLAATDIIACPVGYHSDGTSLVCSECPAGTYQDSGGSSFCLSVPPGNIPNAFKAATGYTPCPAGYFSDGSTLKCTVCPSGTYQSNSGSVLCLSVPVGYIPNAYKGATGYLACNPGYYSDGSSLLCTPCPEATFQPDFSGVECFPVPAGHFANAYIGATGYIACAAGYYSDGTALVCTECPSGSYQSSDGSTSCDDVPAGSIANAYKAATGIIACPAGYYSLANFILCVECEGGSYQDSQGSTGCINVPEGNIPNAYKAATGYIACRAGYFALGSTLSCFEYPSGTYQDQDGASECKDVPAGSIPNAYKAATGIIACPSGYYSDGTTLICTECQAGTYQDSTGATSCITVPSGNIPNANRAATGIIKCPVGYFSDGTSLKCTECPPGTYQSLEGESRCNPVPAGNIASTYKAAAGFTECPGGYHSDGTSLVCYECLPGTYSGNGASKCIVVPVGSKASTYRAASSYTACPVGYFSLGGSISCIPCSKGTYQDSQGANNCKLVDYGYVANAARSAYGEVWCSATEYYYAPNTTVPSENPSISPSTVIPTVRPSIKPSRSPTPAPSTCIPTVGPTVGPSTQKPTKIKPTRAPTLYPSNEPTEAPTVQPTYSPSTLMPTTLTPIKKLKPTTAPIAPTTSPTIFPSVMPSAEPSETPTDEPSVRPTKAKTTVPSWTPSILATVVPSVVPSVIPTRGTPSLHPSILPSTEPTEKPTESPTVRPTKPKPLSPTTKPSVSPTTATPSVSVKPTKRSQMSSPPAALRRRAAAKE